MDFVDRINEQKRLRSALDSAGSKFIVVYGRRRMGKSTLIKHILNEDDVYYEAIKSESAVQMSLLVNAIQSQYPSFGGMTFASWENLLQAFSLICKENSTLVLDEFPYLVQKEPSLPSILQRLVDSGSLRFNLIICGSSQRMMQKLVLDKSEPLYGRADEKINLAPISLKSWQQVLGLEPISAIEEYSVWGGVPRYWCLRENIGTLGQALDKLVFDEQGLLYDEPASLFMDEVNDIAPYSSIMTTLASGNNRFSKVANAIGKKTTELSLPLANLIEMHYIRKEVPFGESEDKSKKTLYFIEDPFITFYYHFVMPYRSLLAIGRKDYVKELVKRDFNDVVGHCWEYICRLVVSGNEAFGETWGIASRWWGSVPVFEEGKKTPVAY
ncbi:MAG: ATP-binding protein, partial [Bacteroidales bacterium]|nr:ATP-binding protein [Bacteroidales bacterium]